MEIVTKLVEMGVSGGILVVLAYLIITLQKGYLEQTKTLTDILLKIEERMTRQEAVSQGILSEMKEVKDLREEMINAIGYCQKKNN